MRIASVHICMSVKLKVCLGPDVYDEVLYVLKSCGVVLMRWFAMFKRAMVSGELRFGVLQRVRVVSTD